MLGRGKMCSEYEHLYQDWRSALTQEAAAQSDNVTHHGAPATARAYHEAIEQTRAAHQAMIGHRGNCALCGSREGVAE
jgi:predicted O-methyltransferase YrrM